MISNFIFGAAVVLFISGCAAPNASTSRYSASELTGSIRTIEAIVVSKRQVIVDGTSAIGGASGAALGGIAGSSAGGNTRGHLAGAIVGAVAGGLIGAAAQSSATQQNAIEYIVKSDVTGLLTIIQTEADINVGEKVFLILANKPVIIRDTR